MKKATIIASVVTGETKTGTERTEVWSCEGTYYIAKLTRERSESEELPTGDIYGTGMTTPNTKLHSLEVCKPQELDTNYPFPAQ